MQKTRLFKVFKPFIYDKHLETLIIRLQIFACKIFTYFMSFNHK